MVTNSVTSITVKWQQPSSQPGQLSGYVIKYKQRDGMNYNYMNIHHSLSQAEISDLKANTAYEICVAAFFMISGVGPYSEELIVETKTGKCWNLMCSSSM